jgi:hypothetical protein
MKESAYKISRTDAAKILKVSPRTLDRYIKNGKISIKNHDGRVFLNMEEIKNFSQKKSIFSSKSVYRQNPKNVYRQNEDFVYSKKSVLPAQEATPVAEPVYRQNPENVYRQNDNFVYSDGNKIDHGANIVQGGVIIDNPELENLKKQLKENIEFQQYKETALLGELSQAKISQKEYEKKLKIEKIKKLFVLILFLALLAFQPIWLYFYFFR